MNSEKYTPKKPGEKTVAGARDEATPTYRTGALAAMAKALRERRIQQIQYPNKGERQNE